MNYKDLILELDDYIRNNSIRETVIVKSGIVNIVRGTRYIVDSPSRIQFILPLKAAIGNTFQIVSRRGGWIINQWVGQHLLLKNESTSVGPTGFLMSDDPYAEVSATCTVDNYEWTCCSSLGSAITDKGGSTTESSTHWLNNSGVLIPKGSAVRFNGTSSIAGANADSDANANVIGITLEDVPIGELGLVQCFGVVPTGIVSASNFAEGTLPPENARIQLSLVDGKMTFTNSLSEGNALVVIGIWNGGQLILQIGYVGVTY